MSDWLLFVPLALYALVLSWIAVRSHLSAAGDGEFFLAGGRLGPVSAFISVMATETSVATVVLFPTVGQKSSLVLVWLCFGYLAGRTIAAYFYLPALYGSQNLSIYQTMTGERPLAKVVLTITYLLSKYISGGVRLFLGAFALNQLFPWSTGAWIVVAALVVAIYSLSGGLRAVVVTDQLQGFLILVVGAAIVGVLLAYGNQPLPELRWIDLDVSSSNALSAPALFLGGLVLSIGTHAADQDLLQRVLAVRTLREAQRALVLSALAAGVVIVLYLFVGVLLSRETGLPARSPLVAYAARSGLPLFQGAFAALLAAAAMSTMDSAIHSTGAVWKSLFGRGAGRLWSLWSLCCLTGAALGFIQLSKLESNLLALALGSMNYVNGGLIAVLSLFVFLPRRLTSTGVILALPVGFAITFACNWLVEPRIAWTWTIILSAGGAFLAALVPGFFSPPQSAPVDRRHPGPRSPGSFE